MNIHSLGVDFTIILVFFTLKPCLDVAYFVLVTDSKCKLFQPAQTEQINQVDITRLDVTNIPGSNKLNNLV